MNYIIICRHIIIIILLDLSYYINVISIIINIYIYFVNYNCIRF